ncbi:MAG: DUF4194 domain-containing protein [Clostridiales bacterium]|nr:DUF4194 domain-containing protein [Clostridiales bacterium]
MDFLQGMSNLEQTTFKRICNRLFANCFVIKKNEKTKSDYYFILRYRSIFEEYIKVLGYRLDINEEYGVVQMINQENTNRLNLKLFESIILILLRILYDEKRSELSLSNDVIIDVGEIQDKYLALKIRDKLIDKTTMNNTLKLLKKFNLIELLDKDMTREDSRILIYDSILMAIRVDDIKEAYKKMEIYKKEESNHEETDSSETD